MVRERCSATLGGMNEQERALLAASRAADLQAVARAYHRANETMKRRRHELHEAVVDSVLLLGMSKSEAARISGYTREYVAKLCDERTTFAGSE